MNVEAIGALMKKHDIDGLYLNGAGHTSVTQHPREFVLKFGDLPQLTFFMELADLCNVPLESIKTEHKESFGGCDTCGYGAGITYTVHVPRPGASEG